MRNSYRIFSAQNLPLYRIVRFFSVKNSQFPEVLTHDWFLIYLVATVHILGQYISCEKDGCQNASLVGLCQRYVLTHNQSVYRLLLTGFNTIFSLFCYNICLFSSFSSFLVYLSSLQKVSCVILSEPDEIIMPSFVARLQEVL